MRACGALEAFGDSGGFERMRNIFSGSFATETRRGKNFGGIGKLERIEGTTNAVHGGEVGFGEHFRHHVLLLFPDAVFAGDRTARGETEFEDLEREGFGSFFLTRDVAIVEDERVEIAVTSVENIGDAKAGLRTEASDFGHDLRERGAWDDAVLHDVVGGNAAHGGEGGFAAFPDEGAFGIGLGDMNLPGAVLAGDLVDVLHEGRDFGGGAIEFDEEQRAALGIVGVDGGFGGLDGEVVHHFDGGGKHACSDDVADSGARFVGTRKSGEERAHTFGAFDDAQDNFCGDAESTFRADENASEIVAGGIEMLAAEMDQRAIG